MIVINIRQRIAQQTLILSRSVQELVQTSLGRDAGGIHVVKLG